MIDNSKFDMELKIDIMEYRTRVFCYERGTLVFEKYVDDRTLLEYLILNEVVCSYFCVLAGKHHVKTDGYIDMDWERKSEKMLSRRLEILIKQCMKRAYLYLKSDWEQVKSQSKFGKEF